MPRTRELRSWLESFELGYSETGSFQLTGRASDDEDGEDGLIDARRRVHEGVRAGGKGERHLEKYPDDFKFPGRSNTL